MTRRSSLFINNHAHLFVPLLLLLCSPATLAMTEYQEFWNNVYSRFAKLNDNNQNQTQRPIPTPSLRIVGGTPAYDGDYPFFVEWGGCGASFIHEDILLSAAHCRPIRTNRVIVGGSRRGVTSNSNIAQARTIVARRAHPRYRDSSISYDFMVMKLNRAVTNIEPISLNPSVDVPSSGQRLQIVGFGTTSEGGSPSSTLQQTSVTFVETSVCNASGRYNGRVKGDIMFCAYASGRDSCQGDSGGPIFFKDENNQFNQVGIVSWGFGCARPNIPGVYARVSAVDDWIKQQVCSLSSNPPSYCNNQGDDNNEDNNENVDDTGNQNGSDGGEDPPSNNNTRERVTVRLEITYDRFPRENSWEITRNGITVAQNGQLRPGLVVETVDLRPGLAYQFALRDRARDGICCLYGRGSYTIYAETENGDVELASGNGRFRSVDIKTLDVPTLGAAPRTPPPTPAPSPAPTPGPEPIPNFPPCNICGDDSSNNFANPNALVTLPDGAKVKCSVLSVTAQDGLVSPSFCPGVQSLARDICCNNDNDGSDNGGGDDESESVIQPAPGAPECVDSDNSSFLIDGAEGNRDCDFLSKNMDRFGYLCEFVDVASLCRSSCRTCALFA